MTQPAFSAPVVAALDSYSVPPLPAGFADRLIARAANDAAVATPEQPAIPRQRPHSRHSRSPWARAGRLMGSIGVIGFVTAAAAAAGFFGERIYVPGVTEILVEAQVIAPAKASNPTIFATRAAPNTSGAISTNAALATGGDNLASGNNPSSETRMQTMLAALMAKSEFQKLPVSAKRTAVKNEMRQLGRSGNATPARIRSARHQARAARAAHRDIPPEIRGNTRAQIAKRIKAKRLRQSGETKPAAAKIDSARMLAKKTPATNTGATNTRAAVKSAIVKSAAGKAKPAPVKAQATRDSGKIYTVIEPRAAVMAPPPRAKTKAAIDRARRLPAPPAGASRRDAIRNAVRKRNDARLPAQRPDATRAPRGSLKPAPSRSKPRPAPRPKPHRPRKSG